MAFGENLHKLWKTYRLSREDVASAINLKRSDIAAVEKGDRVLNDEELDKLADFIGIDIVDLLSQEKEISRDDHWSFTSIYRLYRQKCK